MERESWPHLGLCHLLLESCHQLLLLGNGSLQATRKQQSELKRKEQTMNRKSLAGV